MHNIYFVLFLATVCLASHSGLAQRVQIRCDNPDRLSWDEWDREWRKPPRAIERNLIFEFDRKMGRARVRYVTSWYAWRTATFVDNFIAWQYTDRYGYSFNTKKNFVVETVNGFYLRFPNCIEFDLSKYQ